MTGITTEAVTREDENPSSKVRQNIEFISNIKPIPMSLQVTQKVTKLSTDLALLGRDFYIVGPTIEKYPDQIFVLTLEVKRVS